MDQVIQKKNEGNAHFAAGEYQDAINCYTESIFVFETQIGESEDKLILSQCYGNRAACYMSLDDPEKCISDCDRSLELHIPYPKVRLRKVWGCKALKKFNDALTELKKAIEEDPSLQSQKAGELADLEKRAAEENERLKDEAMTQLKDLGNKFLGLFGMSTDNFQMQDNGAGGYNIQFKR